MEGLQLHLQPSQPVASSMKTALWNLDLSRRRRIRAVRAAVGVELAVLEVHDRHDAPSSWSWTTRARTVKPRAMHGPNWCEQARHRLACFWSLRQMRQATSANMGTMVDQRRTPPHSEPHTRATETKFKESVLNPKKPNHITRLGKALPGGMNLFPCTTLHP